MRTPHKIMQVIAASLMFNLIGIGTLCAQESQGKIEVADNQIVVNKLNTDLVKSPQIVDSNSATEANTEWLITNNFLIKTDTSSNQMPVATNLPDVSKNAVNNQVIAQVTSDTSSNQMLVTTNLPDVSKNAVNNQVIAQVTSDTSSNQMPVTTNFPDVSKNAVNNQEMAQVTSVSELSDVQPTDWAFQALQSLVERYGAIAGYPNGTFRGNRALTRYEFAAGLNAALDRVSELIATGTADLVTKEDLVTLQKLQSEFAGELAVLRSRVDTLEANTAKLEANQFSTTTKLNGEVVIGLASVLAGENANGQSIDRTPTLSYRVRLNLDTSFTGKDLLTTRLQASNVTPLGSTNSGPTLTNEGRLEYDGDSGNQVGLALLRYRFPLGPRTNFYLAGTGNGFVDLDASSQLNPYFDGGAVSLFGLRNPIYNYSGGSGFGLRHLFSDKLELNLGYLTPGSNAGKPTPKNGLFDGVYAGMAQVIISPTNNTRIGLTYINSYSPSYFTSGEGLDPALNPDFIPFGTSTGSNLSNSNFDSPVIINAYGLSGTFQLNPNFAIGGWVGYANQRYIGKGDADVWNWAVTLAFPDLGKKGSLGGILVGMEPKVTGIDSALNGGRADQDTSLHLEAFYKYQLTDNIQLTPGVIWLTAPNHDQNNDDIVIGVLRSVYRF